MSMTLDEWARECWKVVDLRPHVLIDYQRKYRNRIKPILGNRAIDSITPRDIRLWIKAQKPGPKSRATTTNASLVKSNLPVLKTLFREALEAEVISSNPTVGVKRPKHIPAHREFLTLDELEALTPSEDHKAVGLWPVYLFLAHHGLRFSEWAFLKPEVDIITLDGEEYINVTRSVRGLVTKSGKPRLVPYLGGYVEPEFSYSWYRDQFQKLTKSSSHPTGLTIHSLRKTFAYTLKEAGVPMQVAQQLLGHSSIQLTMDIYTDVRPDEIKRAGDALRKKSV